MMRTWAIYLWPRGPSRPVYSDTLFGAVCWAWRAVHGAHSLEQLLAGTGDAPPFVTSSAFPVVRVAHGVVRTFPAPLIVRPAATRHRTSADKPITRQQVRDECREDQAVREFGKIPYVSEGILQEVAAGESLEHLARWLVSRDEREKMVTSGLFAGPDEWSTLPEDVRGRPLWREADILRNQTDRIAGATARGMLFSVPARFYARKVGLWFALRADALAPFVPCLRYLADTGIGGKRSVGLGHFAVSIAEIHDLALPGTPAPGRFISLSRYVPGPDEILPENAQSSYRMIPWFPKHESRGARPGLRLFKGRVWAMSEGSVLVPREIGREVYGRCIRVAGPQDGPGAYPVYHNGSTIPVFLPAESKHV